MRAAAARRTNARGPVLRAVAIGLVGAVILVLVGGVLASTAGLLFVAGATGAGIGLALSRAAVPSPTAEIEAPALSRPRVLRLAVIGACLAVLVGAAGTWVYALAEGGALGPLEYIWRAFGPFVPAELIVASLGAAWGARAGPVTAR